MIKKKFSLKAIVSLAISITLLGTQVFASCATSNHILDEKESEAKVELVAKEKNTEISKISLNGNSVFITKKSISIDPKSIQYNNTNDEELNITLTEELKNTIKKTPSISKGTRTYFSFASSLEEATKASQQIESSTNVKSTDIQAQASTSFWHSSYIEDYYSWLGHGYHVHLEPLDAGYIKDLMGAGSGAAASAIALALNMSGGAAIVLGLIVGVAVVTLYWLEANPDGSLDIWSPDALRGAYNPYHGVQVGTAKVGNHWYPIIVP